jgi:hypothetical protein
MQPEAFAAGFVAADDPTGRGQLEAPLCAFDLRQDRVLLPSRDRLLTGLLPSARREGQLPGRFPELERNEKRRAPPLCDDFEGA